MNKGELNGLWKGDSVGKTALHMWVRRYIPKPNTCDECKIKPPLDLANISNKYNPKTYTRDFKNWLWLCRSCHMKIDGRVSNLNRGGKLPYYKSCLFCNSPHKSKGLCNKHYKQLRAYGVLYV